MAHRMTPAEYRAAVQRAAREQQRAVDKYNREVREHNNRVAQAARERQRAIDKYNRDARDHNNRVAQTARERQRAIDKYNRDARDHNKQVERAVDAYNRGVRQYNFKVVAHNREVVSQRQRLQDEIRRLNARPATLPDTYRQSVQTLATTYEVIDEDFVGRSPSTAEAGLRDWASVEAANSAYLANALEGDVAGDDDTTAGDLSAPSMTEELSTFSEDVVSRWAGALFALNPKNPDAARHFCASAREVLTAMLDYAAPDSSVLAADPNCQRTERGTPTRRAKITHLLKRNNVAGDALGTFVDADLEDVVNLFRMFNDGTHGHAGRFNIPQLAAIRTRVESAIRFIYYLTAQREAPN